MTSCEANILHESPKKKLNLIKVATTNFVSYTEYQQIPTTYRRLWCFCLIAMQEQIKIENLCIRYDPRRQSYGVVIFFLLTKRR